jgi:hypothetical protein
MMLSSVGEWITIVGRTSEHEDKSEVSSCCSKQ